MGRLENFFLVLIILAAIAAIGLIFAPPKASGADFYQWESPEGVVEFTDEADRVPEGASVSARTFEEVRENTREQMTPAGENQARSVKISVPEGTEVRGEPGSVQVVNSDERVIGDVHSSGVPLPARSGKITVVRELREVRDAERLFYVARNGKGEVLAVSEKPILLQLVR